MATKETEELTERQQVELDLLLAIGDGVFELLRGAPNGNPQRDATVQRLAASMAAGAAYGVKMLPETEEEEAA